MRKTYFGDLSEDIDLIIKSRGVSKYQVMAFYEKWQKANPKGIPEFKHGSREEANAFIEELQTSYRMRLAEDKEAKINK